MGNLGSVESMISACGYEAKVCRMEEQVEEGAGLVLPGVGHFANGIRNIRQRNFDKVIALWIDQQWPVLGVCLGMQLMLEFSEEGNVEGLGVIGGRVHGFKDRIDGALKVPHMGWNVTTWLQDAPLGYDVGALSKFYFVHSYYVELKDSNEQLCESEYGIKFCSGYRRGNVFGLQFHPEKSHVFGKRVFEGFCSLVEG